MNQKQFRVYERTMVFVLTAIAVAMLLSSCATQRNNYQDHLRSTPTQNWVRHDNGGCGWAN